MDLQVLDTNFNVIAILDAYESFIWTDRYDECGDFELYTPLTNDILGFIKAEYYIRNKKSEHVMIVESLEIKSDVDEGTRLTVTGRSLESILDRRIIWKTKTISDSLQNAVKTLLNECIISPEDGDRKIDNFIFEDTDDPAIAELSVEGQYTGDNLYDVIHTICDNAKIGFKITLNDSNQFVFKLYSGIDRSYDQLNNPYVVFSPSFENLANSNYVESISAMKNVALVGGEGEGTARVYATAGSASGLGRREMFTDANGVSSDNIGTASSYSSLLVQKGNEELAENSMITSFEGEAETSITYKYGEDFFIGDIVQLANEYGHETKARVVEMVMSEDTSSVSAYPTFETITEEGE